MTEAGEDKQVILVVDDAKENIKILSDLLRDQARIVFAMNGEQALSKAQTSKPDLILLDVAMPGMDGYEVCDKLKSDPKTSSIPVVFVTGMSDEKDEEKGLSLGAIDYITKPFAPAIVQVRVQNHLRLQQVTEDLVSANEELVRLATTDPLTGVDNRRRFLEASDQELSRFKRYGHPLCALMLDIDHFKKVNDTYGHDVGDKALIAVAECCTNVIRGDDHFGRLGGEEFAALLPETDMEGGILLAERLRERIKEIEIETEKEPLKMTVSIGITKAQQNDHDVDPILKRADEALYHAKQNGRDQVVESKNGR